MQEFQSHQLDSLNKFRKVNKYLGNLSDIAWYVIIDNKAARKRMDEFRECLDKLIEYYKV